jgi:phosphoribosylformylglycinamidine cyclo-ligase
MSLSYESSGVNYDQLDAFKRACQKAAKTTAPLLELHGYAEPANTRGESCYLMEAGDHFLAHVEEGLGTKNLVADAVYTATGKNFYREISIDTVATIVNDLVTCGALPISVAMHAAVGESAWFTDAARMQALVEGWAEGCRQAGAVWGGGETPTLRGIVHAEAIVLAGSAIGKIEPKSQRITGDVRDGDAIVFLASSGVQTNGLSLCRLIASKLPLGYQTPIGHGDPRTYGEALLAPSVIYVIHTPGEEPALFKFLREAGPIDLREAYATFNQGVGFAAYVAPENLEATLAAAKASGYRAWHAGTVRKEGDRKAVTIPGLGLAYDGSTLQVR